LLNTEAVILVTGKKNPTNKQKKTPQSVNQSINTVQFTSNVQKKKN